MSAERWAGVVGALVAVAAVSPPFDAAAERSLTAHMIQHLTLVTVAAPVLGFALRRPVRGWVMAACVVGSSAALWLWHAPALFDAADAHVLLHMAEHLTLLATAVALYAVVWQTGSGVLALFAATLPATVLGAAMTLAGHPWYAAYPRLDDQRVAGALMWAAGSAPGLLAAAIAFAVWLGSYDARARTA